MTTASFDNERRPAGPNLETFLDGLARTTGKQPRRVGKEYRALCPVPSHGDTNESLDVRAGDRQPVVAICRSHGCQWSDILAACGFDVPRAPYRPPTRTAPVAPTAKAAKRRELGPVAAEYRYVDEAGELLYVVTRFDPKDFRQRRPDPDKPGRWRWNLDGVRRVPYRLPQLRAALAAGRRVYLAEGKKDAEPLAALGREAPAHAQARRTGAATTPSTSPARTWSSSPTTTVRAGRGPTPPSPTCCWSRPACAGSSCPTCRRRATSPTGWPVTATPRTSSTWPTPSRR